MAHRQTPKQGGRRNTREVRNIHRAQAANRRSGGVGRPPTRGICICMVMTSMGGIGWQLWQVTEPILHQSPWVLV